MKKELIFTADGSKTLFVPELKEYYHSIHGALAEAKHVFLKNGLQSVSKEQIAILEMGLGTGLNAFLSFLLAASDEKKIDYTALEAHPLSAELVDAMGYVALLNAQKEASFFQKIHTCQWESKQLIAAHFSLTKIAQRIEDVCFNKYFDLIYYDAFGPRVQPELWTEIIFSKLYASMNKGGMLVTYCAKGTVKRALKAVGFEVESLEGPPGKREMTRAKKIL